VSRRVPPRGFFNSESPFGRLPTEPSFPTIRVSRRGVLWIVAIAVALLLLFLLKPFATLYTDYLWFRSLGYGGVFGTRFSAQIWSFFIFAILFWIIGSINVLLVLNSGRRLSSIGIRQRLVTAPSTILGLLGVFLLGLLFGQIASGQWQTILTFLNQKPFNVQDPIWHKDVSFYVFTLPFYRFLWGWLLGVVILMILVVAGLYASRAGLQNFLLPARAIRHLSVLAAAFAALLAIHYRLDLYELLLSKRGFVFGVGYADVAARIPAYWIMTVLMVLITIGLLANAAGARLTPLPAALVVWLGAAFVLLVVFPGIIQRFQVDPSAQTKEAPYIKNEIAFTRQAYGLAGITDRPFTPRDTVTADAVARNPQTVQNARLWDPQLALPAALENQQSLRTYYTISDVAVDRYQLGDQYLQMLLSARELDTSGLNAQAQTWPNLKLQYTHGYGVVAARANEATAEGDPVLILKNIPPAGQPAVTQPGIYFGRHSNDHTDYVLVDSSQAELDYLAETTHLTHWTGKTGVPLTSALRKLAFAVRFGDINVLISPQLTSQTQVLFNQAVQDRVAVLAPFLQFDQDPYIVVVDGKLYWILDGFTTTDHYPYSRTPPVEDRGPLSDINYVRNSVKVVVDAYAGTTTFYQIDSKDAIANTYGSFQCPGGAIRDVPRAGSEHALHSRGSMADRQGEPGAGWRTIADAALLRHHAAARRGERRVRHHPALHAEWEDQHDRLPGGPLGPTGLRHVVRLPLPQGQPRGWHPAGRIEHRPGPGDQVTVLAAQLPGFEGHPRQSARPSDRDFAAVHRARLPGGQQRQEAAAEEGDRGNRTERGDGRHPRQGPCRPARPGAALNADRPRSATERHGRATDRVGQSPLRYRSEGPRQR